MLSAFKARLLVELKQRDKSKIESIITHGDRLIVGLNTGTLRVYRVNENSCEPSATNADDASDPGSEAKPVTRAVDLLREHEKFAKHKIEQLAIVKEAEILLSLSNGYVHIHNLESCEFLESLAKSKGASVIAVTSDIVKETTTDINSIITSLAVAVKKRLIIWTWQDGDLRDETAEFSLLTNIRSLTWVSESRLVAGLTNNYVLVDWKTSTIIDIVGPGSIGGAPGQDGGRFSGAGVAGISYLGMASPLPLAAKLLGKEIILARDINTHYIDLEGIDLERRQIPWSSAPEAIGYSYPYLLALQAGRGMLEVRNPQTQSLLQKIALPSATSLHAPHSTVSLAHAGKGFLVTSDRCAWQLQALDYASQIDALVQHSHLDEAISLLNSIEEALLVDKVRRLKVVKILKAQVLFDSKRFRTAIDLFSEADAPPQRVVSLYPPSIAGVPRPSESHEPSAEHEALSRSPGKTGEISNHDKTANDNSISIATSLNKPDLEGKDLQTATEELRGFLVSARTKMKRVLDPDGSIKSDEYIEIAKADPENFPHHLPSEKAIAEQELRELARLIDTTLFRAYMFVSPSFAGPLFRIDNFCDPDVVHDKLIEAGRFNDLVDFYNGKKLHREALELLREFGDEEQRVIAPQLKGPARTIAYLQALPASMIDLVLEFSEWPLQSDPETAIEIFIGDSENAETLPRAHVLDFLDNLNHDLAIRYLEHVINDLQDMTPVFHQRLVDSYVQRLQASDPSNSASGQSWQKKLNDFLRLSTAYTPYAALSKLPDDDSSFYEARALVLSKMGRQEQALHIYVFKMGDSEKAEEYCNEIYVDDMKVSRPGYPLLETEQPASQATQQNGTEFDKASIYHSLLSLYLNPPQPHQPQLGPALSLLAKHGARMPAASTLELIPEILPVAELEQYFRGQLRLAATISHQKGVEAAIRSVVASDAEETLRLGSGRSVGKGGRSRRVLVSEDRVCRICYKRFGGSAIKILPDNTVVHYGCSSNSG